MREVKAIIRPQRLDAVIEALRRIPALPGVTVSTVHAYRVGPAGGNLRSEGELEADFTKLEIFAPESLVDEIVRAIAGAGHTGRAGDGLVLVIPVERLLRIRDADAAGGGN